MARTKTTTTEPVDVAPLNEQTLNQLQNTGSALIAEHSEERDLVNQLLGQVQMANSFARFADVVSLTKLKHIKETKMYRALAGKKGVDPHGNEIADVGTFDGFCQALGLSRSKVDEDLANLNAFGEQALNQLSALGVGYRELRQFRKLPDDSRSALIEAAKTGNHEAVEFLAEELIAKHQTEKEQLTKERDDVRQNYEAQGARLADQSRELEDAKVELEKVKRRIQTMPPAEGLKEMRMEVSGMAIEAESLLTNKLRVAFETMVNAGAEAGQDQRAYLANLLRQIELNILAIREDYDLPDNDDPDATDWMAPDALERAQAAIEGN
ncbi:hypothetical protein [Halopseudomonas aestusnigri]|uniref:DUF3102 domain-containing protein n=1 Tax=Halopseudomonas aestusnigri TaxID=857252 RepID=A0AAQ1G9Z6_9GAMM|nr:hypothetical protein [Halopseudomonas aestusnigri]OWL84599.1 hypothetical protein B7O88_16260 [Halopseudomonas aestusnigri]SEG69962.1 hypothetical protein SAMN05216586_11638 [Halopseudomonas aestusnigri]